MAYEMSVNPDSQSWLPEWAAEPQMSVDPAYESAVDFDSFTQQNSEPSYGGQSSLLSSNPLDISGWSSSSSEAPEVKTEEPEQQSFLSTAWDSLKKFFDTPVDKEGRSQQSLGASVVVGAAQEVLKMMAANKAAENATNLESQKSSNRIKEKTEEENRIRAAASAMPAMPSRGARTVAKPGGILSTAK